MSDRSLALDMLAQSQAAEAQNLPLSYQILASSVTTDSTAGLCWFQMGNANWGLKLGRSAVACYRRALQCELPDELRPKVMNALGHALHHTGQNEEAHGVLKELTELHPEMPLPWFNLSMVESVKGYGVPALEHARTAVDLQPCHPPLQLNLAFQLMFSGRMMEGLRYFAARFPYRLQHFANYPYPQWDGTNKDGKTVVFCVSEQGIGDTLAYARFVERAAKRASFIHLGVQPELARLFRAGFQHLPNINVLPQPCPFPPATHWTTFMSLPTALGMTDEEFFATPNIKIPNFSMGGTQWKDKHAKFHIGVAWGGSPANDIDVWRSFPIHYLLELYEIPGIQLYALQTDDRAQEIHSTGSATLIKDMRPFIRDVADTTAVMRELDLVITCEGVLGHIAGAMNVPCWIAYSYQGRTVHLGHDPKPGEVPFYPKHWVFKQGWNHDWKPVFGTIKDNLHDFMEKRVLQQRDGSGAR